MKTITLTDEHGTERFVEVDKDGTVRGFSRKHHSPYGELNALRYWCRQGVMRKVDERTNKHVYLKSFRVSVEPT